MRSMGDENRGDEHRELTYDIREASRRMINMEYADKEGTTSCA